MHEALAAAHSRPAGRLRVELAAVGLLLAASACWRSEGGGPGAVVARLGEESLRRSELEEYLSLNLPQEPAEDSLPAAQDDADRVKSRLLESWIDERLLLQEARRRGLFVSDAEVAAAADAEFSADESPQRALPRELQLQIVRTRLTVAALQADLVALAAPPTEQEIREHLERSGRPIPGTDLVVRALMLDSAETAARVYAEIRRGSLSFSEAVAAHETSPAQGVPLTLPVQSLPPGFGAALRHLKPGEVSPPLEFHGDAYLFQIADSTDAEDAKAELYQEARWELEGRKLEDATDGLLQQLRAGTPIEIKRRQLPFHYVAAAAPDSGIQ